MSGDMKAWADFLKQLELELGAETVNKWLRPLKIQRFDACNLHLEAPDSFKAIWFEEHMRHRVRERLVNNNNKKIRVHLKVKSLEPEKEEDKTKRSGKAATMLPLFSLGFDQLTENANFEKFITSPSANLLAYKILYEASECSPPPFNPIYLFGRSGVGKTHLLMATAAKMQASGKKVIYVRGETFTEHVVQAIRGGEMQTFRKVYRNVDALLIDDIEIFARKSATQEEFFHTFNTLHVEGKLIALSAKCSPNELQHIEPRLTSRFEWGIVVPIQGLEKEKLEVIVRKKINELALNLQEAAIFFLLEHFSSNLPALMRAVEALALRLHLHYSSSKVDQLTVEEIKKAIADLLQEEEKSVLTPAKIIRAVAEYYGIRMDDILSKSQARECAIPRQIAMHLCRHELKLPFMKIGDIFSRDHSTVMTSVKQIQKNISDKNQDITLPLKGIRQLLEQH